jgi:hypothetical protein
VSTPQPPRRRRIAGESKPGSPAPKTPVIKKAAKIRTPAKTPPPSTPAAPEAPARPTPPPAAVTTEARTRRFSLPRVSGRFGLLIALTVAAVAFGAVFGVRGFLEWRENGSIVEAHEKAATTAASAGETIFTYQYNQLDEHLRDSKAIMTPSFGKKFESIAPALRNLAPQRKIQVKATVRNAAAVECGDACSPDKATVLVFIDQARVADGAKEPTVFGNRIKLEMVRDDGTWLVDDVQAL